MNIVASPKQKQEGITLTEMVKKQVNKIKKASFNQRVVKI